MPETTKTPKVSKEDMETRIQNLLVERNQTVRSFNAERNRLMEKIWNLQEQLRQERIKNDPRSARIYTAIMLIAGLLAGFSLICIDCSFVSRGFGLCLFAVFYTACLFCCGVLFAKNGKRSF